MPVPSPTRCGSHPATKAGMAGWVTATPMPITTVAAKRSVTSDAAPRDAQPNAVSSRPATTAGTTPIRATRREPTRAATANTITGTALRTPISVPERWNSLRSAGITGGTAKNSPIVAQCRPAKEATTKAAGIEMSPQEFPNDSAIGSVTPRLVAAPALRRSWFCGPAPPRAFRARLRRFLRGRA